NEATPALKAKLAEALALKGAWDGHRRELAQVVADLQRLNADQDRIRKNLRETPPAADVYKTYLTKLSDQEKEIDALTAKQKKLPRDAAGGRRVQDAPDEAKRPEEGDRRPEGKAEEAEGRRVRGEEGVRERPEYAHRLRSRDGRGQPGRSPDRGERPG